MFSTSWGNDFQSFHENTKTLAMIWFLYWSVSPLNSSSWSLKTSTTPFLFLKGRSSHLPPLPPSRSCCQPTWGRYHPPSSLGHQRSQWFCPGASDCWKLAVTSTASAMTERSTERATNGWNLSVFCVSLWLSVSLSFYLSARLSVCLSKSTSLLIHLLKIYQPTYRLIDASINLSIHASSYRSIYLCVYLIVCLSYLST